MKFAFENQVEPVHIFKLGVLTRHANETPETLASYENKVTTILPFWQKEDFAEIKQGDKGKC
jgi:hypothetical protein